MSQPAKLSVPVFKTKADWTRSHFTKATTSVPTKTTKCIREIFSCTFPTPKSTDTAVSEPCGASFALTTSTTTLSYHLEHIHQCTAPEYLTKDVPSPAQATLEKFGVRKHDSRILSGSHISSEAEQRQKVALAFVMNPGMAFATADDEYFRAAFGSCLAGVNRGSLPDIIRGLESDLDGALERLISGEVVSVIFDGGKDINRRKLIGSGVIWNSRCLFLELVETDLAVLDTAYYKRFCLRLVDKLTKMGCVVVSFTVDNEASENAGIRECITEHNHLLHFR
jgi:hypothetical protein